MIKNIGLFGKFLLLLFVSVFLGLLVSVSFVSAEPSYVVVPSAQSFSNVSFDVPRNDFYNCSVGEVVTVSNSPVISCVYLRSESVSYCREYALFAPPGTGPGFFGLRSCSYDPFPLGVVSSVIESSPVMNVSNDSVVIGDNGSLVVDGVVVDVVSVPEFSFVVLLITLFSGLCILFVWSKRQS